MDDQLVCDLLKSNHLYTFAAQTLFKMFKKAKSLGVEDLKSYIQSDFIGKTKTISRIAFNCSSEICDKLISANSADELLKVCHSNDIKLMQLTGALYKFSWEPKLIEKAFDRDKALQKEFMNIYCELFGESRSISWRFVRELAKRSNGDWFIPWIYTYGKRDRTNIVRASMNYDKVYVREALGYSRPMTKRDYHIKRLTRRNCQSRQLPSGIHKFALGDSYFKVVKNGVFENLMKTRKQRIVSGFSGSCIMIYQMIFDIYKLHPKTFSNKVNVLLLILADFAPLYHSVPEILVTYTREAHFDKPFTLDMSDVGYVKRLIKAAKIDLDTTTP